MLLPEVARGAWAGDLPVLRADVSRGTCAGAQAVRTGGAVAVGGAVVPPGRPLGGGRSPRHAGGCVC